MICNELNDQRQSSGGRYAGDLGIGQGRGVAQLGVPRGWVRAGWDKTFCVEQELHQENSRSLGFDVEVYLDSGSILRQPLPKSE